jgi:hypothetical protein
MKHLFEKIQKGPRLSTVIQSKLEIARFRKLLENARAIMDLIADGREKLKDEYIFDRHYVTSLVDNVLERSGMLVFDAVVLAPTDGDELYRLYDELKNFAVDQFIRDNDQSKLDKNVFPDLINIPEEPEFRLLSQVLAWLAGPLSNGNQTMMDFIRRVFDHIIPVLRNGHYIQMANSWLALNSIVTRHEIQVIDIESEPVEGQVVIHDLECRPLGLMLIGAGGTFSENPLLKSQTLKKWIAFIGKDHLSLRGTGTDNKLYLETTLSGHMDSDFIFIFFENPLDPANVPFPGFHIEKTRLGTMAWSYDVSGQAMENSLTRLGAHLLGPPDKAE